jgi:hypothetical protein
MGNARLTMSAVSKIYKLLSLTKGYERADLSHWRAVISSVTHGPMTGKPDAQQALKAAKPDPSQGPRTRPLEKRERRSNKRPARSNAEIDHTRHADRSSNGKSKESCRRGTYHRNIKYSIFINRNFIIKTSLSANQPNKNGEV